MQISRPWPGTYIGDAGPYSGAQWSRRLGARHVDNYRGPFEEKGYIEPRGPIAGSFRELWVEPTAPASLAVQVRRGSAFVDDCWYHNNFPAVLAVEPNTSGLTRYDRVVLRKLWDMGTIRAVVLSGAPGGAYPALTQNPNIQWEIPIALITITTGLGAIAAANITDEREFANDRYLWMGLGDWEGAGANPAVINEILWTVDTKAWEFGDTPAAIYEITGVFSMPTEWGDSALTVTPYAWVSTNAFVGRVGTDLRLSLWERTYTSGAAAANLVNLGALSPPDLPTLDEIYRHPCPTFTAIPGRLTLLALRHVGLLNHYDYVFGMEFHCSRR